MKQIHEVNAEVMLRVWPDVYNNVLKPWEPDSLVTQIYGKLPAKGKCLVICSVNMLRHACYKDYAEIWFIPFDEAQQEYASDLRTEFPQIKLVETSKESGWDYNNLVDSAARCLSSVRSVLKLLEKKTKRGVKLIEKLVEEREYMKFDVIVGNPPYQAPGKNSLYAEFIEALESAVNDNGYTAYIIPGVWVSTDCRAANVHGIMRSTIQKGLIYSKYFAKHVASSLFCWPSVIGGITWFVRNKSYNGPIVLENAEYGFSHCIEKGDLTKFSSLPLHNVDVALTMSILDKIESKNLQYYSSIHNRGSLKSNQKRAANVTNLLCRTSKGTIYVEDPSNKVKHLNYKKASFNYYGGSEVNKFQYLDENSVCTESFMYFIVSSKEEAYSVESYLTSKFVTYLRKIVTVNYAMTPGTFRLVPIIPTDHNWTDEEIYDFFNLTDEEISEIEKVNDMEEIFS